MSWILGIDTSSVDLGIGLYKDNQPVATYSRFIRNSHAEHIANVVDMLLNVNGVKSHDIGHVAVSTGPGSFTGLRIGIAFTKGFCFGRPALVLPVSSLEVLAYSASNHEGRIVTAIDARNDTVFYALFENKKGRIERISEDCSADVIEFKNILCQNDIIITDTMGYVKSSVFNFLNDYTRVFPVENYPVQRGLVCAQLGSDNFTNQTVWKNELDIVPNYLRSSSAQKSTKAMMT